MYVQTYIYILIISICPHTPAIGVSSYAYMLHTYICYRYVLILVALNGYIRSATSADASATASWCTDALLVQLVQTHKRTNTDASTNVQTDKY